MPGKDKAYEPESLEKGIQEYRKAVLNNNFPSNKNIF